LVGCGLDGFAEREAAAPQHDAQGGQAERQVKGAHDVGERGREAGPEDDQAVDQPGVVGFPDRTEGVVDDRAGGAAAFGAAGGQVPETGAEVGAREDGVTEHAEHEGDRDGGAHDRGPYGTGVDQRRRMPFRTRIAAVPTPR
jgi:hypothetical protein